MTPADTLKPYGYTLDAAGQILHPSGKQSGLFVKEKRGRVRVEMIDGSLVFSGPDAGSLAGFVEKFWYAKRITQ